MATGSWSTFFIGKRGTMVDIRDRQSVEEATSDCMKREIKHGFLNVRFTTDCLRDGVGQEVIDEKLGTGLLHQYEQASGHFKGERTMISVLASKLSTTGAMSGVSRRLVLEHRIRNTVVLMSLLGGVPVSGARGDETLDLSVDLTSVPASPTTSCEIMLGCSQENQ